jgi:hypothetical protein
LKTTPLCAFEKVEFHKNSSFLVVSKRVMKKEAECCCARARQNARSDRVCLELLAPPFLSREKVGKDTLEELMKRVKPLTARLRQAQHDKAQETS